MSEDRENLQDPGNKNKPVFKKYGAYNLANPISIFNADVKLAPRMYRATGKKNEVVCVNKTLKQRGILDLDDKGCVLIKYPLFESETLESTLVLFRFAGVGNDYRQNSLLQKVFVDVFSGNPPQSDEAFFSQLSIKGEHRYVELSERVKQCNASKIKIVDKEHDSEICSVVIKIPCDNIDMIEDFVKRISESSNNITHKVERIIRDYNGENSDCRVLTAEDIILRPYSYTTEKLMVRGRQSSELDGNHKGMPVRISYKENSIVFETIEINTIDQIKYLCDNRESCDQCSRRYCMRLGTGCSWSTRKDGDKYCSYVGRLIFSRDGFVDTMTKMIYFAGGSPKKLRG